MAKSSAAPATRFEKLKELAEKSTQSKWERDGLGIESGRGTIARCPTPQNEGVFDCHQNAEYIAAANPKAILEILAAHQALYEALSALLPAVDRMVDSFGEGHPSYEYLVNASNAGHAALALADAVQGEK